MNARKLLAFVVATAAVAFGLASGQDGSTAAQAQNVIINCQTSPAPTATPSPGSFVPVNCSSLGGGGATVFPYTASQGQTGATASFLGAVGAYYVTAPTLTNGQINPLSLDQNGNLNVDIKAGGGGSSATPIPYASDGSGRLVISPTNLPGVATSATAPAAGTNIAYVQGTGPGGAIPVTGSITSSTVFPYTAAQGQTGAMASFLGAVGAYYVTAPTLTNGQVNPLSLDQNGNLNVNVKVGGGGGSTTFPYTTQSGGQTATTASAIANGGIVVSSAPTLTAGQYENLNINTNGYLLAQVLGSVTVSNFPSTQAVTLPYTSASPLAVVVTNPTAAPTTQPVYFPSAQPVYQATALPAGTNSIGTVILGAGSATIGSIGNAAFGITNAGTAGGGPQTATSIPAIAAGCVYNSTPLTPTTGQYVPFTCNSSGALQIAGTFTATTQFPYTMVTYAQTAQAASALGIMGAFYAAPTLTTGQVSPARMDASADIYTQVNNPSTNPVPVYAPSALPISGSITAVSSYPYPSTTSSPGLAASSVGISCAYNGAQPTLTSGQVSPILCNTVGDQVMAIDTTSGSGVFSSQATSGYVRMVDASNTNTANVFAPSADALAATQKGIGSNSFGYYYNGSAFNRARDAVIGNNVIGAGVGAVSPYVQYNATLPTLTTAQYGTAQASANGIQYAGAAAVTGVGTTRFPFTSVSTTPTAICTGACTAFSLSAINTTTTLCYIQEFNTAAASVTLGTTAPVRVLALPATSGAEASDNISSSLGENFTTAWSVAATTTPTGSTACGTAPYVQGEYK